MPSQLEGDLSGRGLRIGVVSSRFNDTVVDGLLDGALKALVEMGVRDSDIQVIHVPGAFEIPLAAKKMAVSGRYHAIVCLGAVIRGGTPHFDYVCRGVTDGLMRVGLEVGVPVLFGVLTTDTVEQALARSRGEENKGREAARAAVSTANLFKKMK